MSGQFNVIYASQIGCILDCDLLTGLTATGGTPTNNDSKINNALLSFAAVGVGSSKLILDGGTITGGITLPTLGNYEIEGIGWTSGFYIASGSNADTINNGKILPYDPDTTPPTSGGYVRIANLMLNGNRGDGTDGNSTSGEPQGIDGVYWYSNINLANLIGVRIENVYSFDSAAYSMRLNNCTDVVVEKCRILNPNTTPTGNQDCVHIDGPGTDIRILNNYLNNNFSDDGIAINAPEGYGGPLTRVVISGNTFLDTTSGARIYGATSATIGHLVIANNTGSVRDIGFNFGGGAISPQDISGQAIDISNNVFFIGNGPFIGIDSDVGAMNISNCIWNAPQAASVQGFVVCIGTSLSISSLAVSNCSIYRNTSGSATNTPLLINNGGSTTIKRMTIDNFRVLDEAGQSYSAISSLLAMTNISIGSLFVGAQDYTNITELADDFTNIGSVSGPGYIPPQTTVNGSVSGHAVFSQPFQGPNYKKVIIFCNAIDGTATYAYPVAFSQVPTLFGNGSVPSGSISTTAITVTAASAYTGFLILEGY